MREFEKDDQLKEITKNDKINAFYKFDRKSNYKSNIQNSLGIFEHPSSFSLIHTFLSTLG